MEAFLPPQLMERARHLKLREFISLIQYERHFGYDIHRIREIVLLFLKPCPIHRVATIFKVGAKRILVYEPAPALPRITFEPLEEIGTCISTSSDYGYVLKPVTLEDLDNVSSLQDLCLNRVGVKVDVPSVQDLKLERMSATLDNESSLFHLPDYFFAKVELPKPVWIFSANSFMDQDYFRFLFVESKGKMSLQLLSAERALSVDFFDCATWKEAYVQAVQSVFSYDQDIDCRSISIVLTGQDGALHICTYGQRIEIDYVYRESEDVEKQ